MSFRPAFLSLALLATVLAAAIVMELGDAPAPAGNGTGIVPIRQKPKAGPRAAAQDPSDRTNAWLTTALARPLFSLDRRPTDADPSAATTLGSLPRLTGVVIGPFGQSAIFAATGGGRPTVVPVGKTLGEYTVEKIGPGIVTVSGPEGVHQVSLAADAKARHDMAAELPHLAPAQAQPQAQHPEQVSGQPPGGPRAALRNNVPEQNSRPPKP